MTGRHRRVVAGLLAVLAATGCSKSQETAAATPTPAPTAGSPIPGPTQTAPAACADVSGGIAFTVTQLDFAFQPPCLVASSTQSFQVTNAGSFSHTFTVEGTSIDVTVSPGQTYTGQPTGLDPGTYRFVCRFHENQGMVGSLQVI